MATRSKDTIFNAALLRCGREDSSTGGSGVLWRTMDANYDEVVRAAFEDSDGGLPFGKARVTLTSRSDGEMGYDDAYTMPADVLHVTEVFAAEYAASDILLEWEVKDGKLLLDANSRVIEIEYVKAGQEAKWSANFALGIQRRMEAIIKSFLEEEEEAELRNSQADMYFMKAGVKGGKNRSTRRVWKEGGGRLVRARRTPKGRY